MFVAYKLFCILHNAPAYLFYKVDRGKELVEGVPLTEGCIACTLNIEKGCCPQRLSPRVKSEK